MIEFVWIYLIFPFIGSALGIVSFDCFYKKENKRDQSKDKERQKLDDSLNVA